MVYGGRCQVRQTRPNSGGVAEGHPRFDNNNNNNNNIYLKSNIQNSSIDYKYK